MPLESHAIALPLQFDCSKTNLPMSTSFASDRQSLLTSGLPELRSFLDFEMSTCSQSDIALIVRDNLSASYEFEPSEGVTFII